MGANIFANLLGRVWSIAIGLAFVPVYIRLLGIESYGLIAFYATLVTVMGILDLGLTSTVNRELARSASSADTNSRVRDIVRTLELIYWGIGATLGLVVFVAARFIGEKWIRADHIPKDTLVATVRLMGVVLAVQWPASLYTGGLLGLQRQVLANVITTVTTTLRFAGAAFVLWKVSPTSTAFFWWQAAASVFATGSVAVGLWLQPELRGKATFRSALLGEVWKYAAGVAGISILAVVLMQTDKLVLSKIVPLRTFAYYGLASQVASSLNYVVSPFTTGIFPALCAAASEKNDEKLHALFHSGASLVGGASVPVVMFCALFARDILFAWQRDATTASHAGPILAILAAAALCNVFLNMPYYMLLATGNTRVPLLTNVLSILILVPLLLVTIPRWGAVGAASSWLLVNAVTLVVLPQAVFLGNFRAEKGAWYLRDVLWPLCCASVPLIFIRLVVFPTSRPAGILGLLATALAGSMAGMASAAPARQWVLTRLRTRLA